MKIPSSIAFAVLGVSLALPVSAVCPSMIFTTQQSRTDGDWSINNLETVDYDSDGVLDVVGLRLEGGGGPGTLMAWHGVGDGTFQVPVSLGTSGVYRLTVVDVNNDGRPDIIMSASNQLLVRLGNGSGFDAAIVNSLDHSPFNFVAASLDGDAFVDLVTTTQSPDFFVVYHGEGNGGFTSVRQVTTGPLTSSVAAADFDGDGRADVAYARAGTNNVDVVFKNSDGSYTAPISLQSGAVPMPLYATHTTRVVAADVDEDGLPDLVTSNWEESPAPEAEASVVILRNTGSRTFSRSVLVPGITASRAFTYLRVGDIDGDDHLDIIATSVNGGMIMVLAGQGDGTFYSPTYYKPEGGSGHFGSVATGDFDGDGDTDLAVGSFKDFIAAKGACGSQVTLFSISPVITQGQSAPLRVRVGGIGSATPLPRGTATFREGATILGTADVDANGDCPFGVSGLSLGDHTVTADFSGNTVLSATTSESILQKVTTQTTTIALSFPVSESVYGTPFPVNSSLLTQFGYVSSGWYTLDLDGVKSQRAVGGQIALQLSPGPHTLSASYLGTSTLPPSTYGPQTITTAKATPSIANSSGALSVRLGETHTLQFALTGVSGFAIPAGTVQLKRGSTILATGTLSSGIAALSATLERGAHALTAVYSGDGNYKSVTLDLTLTVMPNLPLAIDARGTSNAIWIRALLPPDTTATTLYRSPAGAGSWTAVPGWTPQNEYDTSVVNGVLFDYRLSATVSGAAQTSNIDAALIFNDDPVIPMTTIIRRVHFNELRLAVNALRSTAGLPPFNFDATYAGQIVMASHLASLRTALTEACQSLGMLPATYTDSAIPGTVIKAVHIQELREQAR